MRVIATDHDQDGEMFGHAKDCADELTKVGVPNAHALLRDWIRRDLVKPLGKFDGRPVYSMADVFRAESETRRNGKRNLRLDFRVLISHD